MDLIVVLAIWLGIVVVSMLGVSYLALRWGRDPFGWALLSAVLGPIAIIALLGTRHGDAERPSSFDRTRGERPEAPQTCVVVGADGSAHSERAAQYIARTHPEADVVLLAVLPAEMRTRSGEQAEREREAAVEKMTAGAARTLTDAGLPVRVIAGYGNAAEEIVRLADEENADVIVIGRRGAGLSKALLGSVSDAVVKRSKRPVAVID